MPAHPEQLLISAVVRQRDVMTAITRGISRDVFHVHQPEWIWIEKYFTRYRKAPSRAALKHKFPDFPIFKADDLEHFVEEVQREHIRVGLTSLIEQATYGIEDGKVARTMDALSRGLLDLQGQIKAGSSEMEVIQDWEQIYEEVSARVANAETTGIAGLPLGFPTLEQLTGGPGPGEFWVIASRLGQGKTWSLIRMASAMTFAGHTIQYDALEQSKRHIGMRLHAFMSSKYGADVFSSLSLMQGRGFVLKDYRKFLRDSAKTVTGKFYVSDTTRGRVNVSTIASQIERNQPQAVFIDYLTLMEQNGDDWRATAELSSSIKSLAEQYRIPIIAAAQINRSGVGKEPPRAEHLSQADAIGQDADALVTMMQQSRSVMKMRLAKYRNGADGQTWFCEFRPGTGKYTEVSGDRALEIMDEDAEEDS